MKKILLFSAFLAASPVMFAQVTLTGTSYTQNFDGIGTGLPTGWTIADSAKADFIGTLIPSSFLSAATYGTYGNGTFYGTRGGFKNFPSADVVAMGSDSATQVAAVDRAIGVRQVSATSALFPNSDPGAAVLLQLSNTTGFKTFSATFKLQSLDTSSPRVTTWVVDYGFGATPTTWTAASTTGTMTTGNNTFSNNNITATFGTALDNKSTPVWIRIVALDTSTGAGNRATTAIDDFGLTWSVITPVGITETTAETNNLMILGDATPAGAKLQFSTPEAGNYSLSITDINGRTCYNHSYTMNAGKNQVEVSGTSFTPGLYFVNISGNNKVTSTRMMVK